jgi:hypothetical protein
MPDRKELEELGIQNWSQIGRQFRESNLLLGNGFSLSIAPDSFHYRSLFDKFLDNCPPEYADRFNKFGTHNFERNLEKLKTTKDVDQILGNDLRRVEEAIDLLKSGLILTIQEIHPRADEKVHRRILQRIAPRMRFFGAIFTLNYDLFLYQIVMIMKDQCEKKSSLPRYSDCFWEEYDRDFNCFNSYQDHGLFRFIYYVHGALFLFREPEKDLKLLRKPNDATELVERVREVIEGGEMPLFVCEGTSREKVETIDRSEYLTFASTKLAEADNLVIFGASLSSQDQHIIEAIDSKENTLAISIHINDKSEEELRREIHQTKRKFTSKPEILFFDSETFLDFLGIGKEKESAASITTEISMLDRVKKHWPEIIEAMRGEGEHGNLDAFMRSACEPARFENGILVLGFYHKFHLGYMKEHNYKQLLESKISKILNMPIKIEYIGLFKTN